MELTITGAIKIDGHLARFTDDGKWMVSRSGAVLGYVDTSDEIVPLIEKNREKVRARLALVQRKAEERKAEEEAEERAILAASKVEKDSEDQEWDEHVSDLDYAQGEQF